MFVYFNTKQTTAVTRSRIVPVTCEKCGCSYFYEMTRIGTDVNVAHYGIDWSVSTAEQRAETEVQRQLSVDAELVPCPKCHWINDDLICRYRNGRYRRLTDIAVIVACTGIALTLFCAVMGYVNHKEHRYVIPYIIAPGLLGSVLIATAMIAIRRWLERRIQPNLLYPEEPKLPLGTPPTFVLNDDDELVLASPNAPQSHLLNDQNSMAFQIGKHCIIPNACCVCMGTADPACSVSIEPIVAINLPIGFCKVCSRKLKFARLMRSIGVAFFVFVVATILAVVAGIREEGIIVVNLLLSVVSGFIVRLLSRNPVRATVVDATRGVLRVSFTNPQFRSLVCERQPAKEAVPDFSFLQHRDFD